MRSKVICDGRISQIVVVNDTVVRIVVSRHTTYCIAVLCCA